MKIFYLPFIFILSCNQPYDVVNQMGDKDREAMLLNLAPYVNKKPKKASYQDRFKPEYKEYYKLRIAEQQSEIKYVHTKDSLIYFFYINKDLTSLFDHYRGHGGYYIPGEEDSILYLEILYYTPRWTKTEVDEKGQVLFREMIEKGNVESYIGNREYIHTPNDDFYYNTTENRWNYTTSSSWNFLKEAKDSLE